MPGPNDIATTNLSQGLSFETLLRIADELPVAVSVLSGPDFEYRYVNRTLQALVPDRPLLGRRFAEAWPENGAQQLEVFRRVMDDGEPIVEEDRRFDLSASGAAPKRTRYMTFRYTPFELDGETGLLVESTDTTDEVEARIQAEEWAAEAVRTARVLSDVFESMGDGFISLDADWKFVYLNGRAEELLHRSRDELIGCSFWDAFPESVGSVFWDLFRESMHTQQAVSFEEYYPPHDMWASVHVLPSPKGLTIYLSDITSEKLAEAAVAKSESQLRAIVDNSPSVIFMKDLDGRFIMVNDEFVSRFDTVKESVLGRTDYDLLPHDSAARVTANDQAVIESGTSQQFEEEVEDRFGNKIIYVTVKFPLKDASGRIYGTAGIATDMNERIRQERALAESEERFRKIFEEGPLGVAILDTDQRFRRVNERYGEILGYSKDEMVGKTLGEITFEEDRARATDLPRRLLLGELPYYRIEKRYIRKNGQPVWVSIHGSLIRDDAGRPLFILALAEDISQRKAAEDALRDTDRVIRQAYTDVIAAVTGGKLVLMTPEEVESALGVHVSPLWRVDEYSDLCDVRHKLMDALLDTGMEQEKADSYVLAASEAFTNAVKHGGGGEVAVHRSDRAVQVYVCDRGPGINFENLPKATLTPGFSTAQSLGMGFTIMLEVCDRLLLSTRPGLTTLVLESLPAGTEETA